jgi:hypothetical protein
MLRRRWRAGIAAALAVAAMIALGTSPVAAAIDHEAAIIDLQLAGFTPAPAEVGANGPIDDEGTPVAPDWKPPSGSQFVGGYMKSWMNYDTGHVVMILAGEFRASLAAQLDKEATVGTVSFDQATFIDGPTPFPVSGIPGAKGATATAEESGYTMTVHVVAFTKGAMSYAVGVFGPAGTVEVATAIDVAAQQHAFGPTVKGELDDAIRAGMVIGVIVVVAIPVVLLGVIGLVIFLVVRSNKKKKASQMTQPAYGWSAPPPPPGYAPAAPATNGNGNSNGHAIRWGSDADTFMPGGQAPAAPAPSVAPASVATTVDDSPAPSTWAHPDSRVSPFAPPESPAPSAPALAVQSQPCPSCARDFGETAECAHCGAARTSCLYCGTKIWAGALTCSTHART